MKEIIKMQCRDINGNLIDFKLGIKEQQLKM